MKPISKRKKQSRQRTLRKKKKMKKAADFTTTTPLCRRSLRFSAAKCGWEEVRHFLHYAIHTFEHCLLTLFTNETAL